jgi:hypothetical protein
LVAFVDERRDLDRVVSENAEPAPRSCTVDAVEPRPVPAVAVFEVADAAFDAGAPLDEVAERSGALDGLAGETGSTATGDGDSLHTGVGERGVYCASP